MNIFVLHESPRTAAQMHCDKHVIKMILESAQMLSTALHLHDAPKRPLQYKPTHAKHPCTQWAAKSRDNFLWLAELGLELVNEHLYRYERAKPHKSYAVIRDAQSVAHLLPATGLTPFAQAMPVHYKRESAVEAYRAYYLGDKMRFVTYKRRPAPAWLRS